MRSPIGLCESTAADSAAATMLPLGTPGEAAASLREAPPPQTPSPEERLAFSLRLFFLAGSACELGAFPIGWVVVTAADRAAATFAALGKEPLRPPMAGTSPFRGGFAWRHAWLRISPSSWYFCPPLF